MNPFQFFLPSGWTKLDTCPLVPGMLRFGGGGGGSTVVSPARATPPAAPAPLAPKVPTQSVADLLTEKRKVLPKKATTLLTAFTGEDTGRRTILGLPIAANR